jgi:hypothetical protein
MNSHWRRAAGIAASGICLTLLAACASTTVTFSPTAPAPVCDPKAAALVLWAPQWRADQKDVAAREAAAAEGIGRFFAESRCFARTEVRRVDGVAAADAAAAQAARAAAEGWVDAVVTLQVRELGPVVKLLSSAALLEGGTEVVLQVSTRAPQARAPAREFSVHWRDGGPGVVKGVASLPSDMAAALRAALQPSASAP